MILTGCARISWSDRRGAQGLASGGRMPQNEPMLLHVQQPQETPEEVLGTAEMAAVDQAAIRSGISIDRLMLAAGRAAAGAVAGQIPPHTLVSVLCGPGNNGGDGYAAAAVLSDRGYTVEIFAKALPTEGAAARAAARWKHPVRPLSAFKPQPGDVVIDALYGAGLSRPIAGEEADALSRLQHSGASIFAIDIPSGLNGDTGLPVGPCVQAHRTITFFRMKPGHLLWPGRGLCGDVTVADIGLKAEHLAHAIVPQLFRNAPALWRRALPGPSRDIHKYTHGHCLVVSGPELQTGASRLAATAALNNGAGAVTIAGDRGALRIHAAHVTAVMLREAATPEAFAEFLGQARFGAAVIGPAAGIGAQTLARVLVARRMPLPLVIDADALTSLAGHVESFRAADGESYPCVMTPHAGEFTRLFGPLLADDAIFAALPALIRTSKVEQARAAARLAQAVIVFKGVDTVIAVPDGRAAINTNAGPELATAGSGDVLSGLIGAHLACGMPAFEAATAAVWLHGFLGARIGTGLTADRLVTEVKPLSALL
jgi:ADP-dependent NAD(P)H-hydrate dehydratase / NAD(P)H-hydrate epimerase